LVKVLAKRLAGWMILDSDEKTANHFHQKEEAQVALSILSSKIDRNR